MFVCVYVYMTRCIYRVSIQTEMSLLSFYHWASGVKVSSLALWQIFLPFATALLCACNKYLPIYSNPSPVKQLSYILLNITLKIVYVQEKCAPSMFSLFHLTYSPSGSTILSQVAGMPFYFKYGSHTYTQKYVSIIISLSIRIPMTF